MLDPTKIIPEELVPVTPIGRFVLNRNVDNFFAETEQVAFCPGHVVPGIDFTDDPILQARLFSYTDTQLSRLGGPNFHQIPINKPVCPFHNNQRDGIHQHTIHKGQLHINQTQLMEIGQQKHRQRHQMVVLKVILKKLVAINFVKEVRRSLIISLNRDYITKALHRMNKNMWSMPILLN